MHKSGSPVSFLLFNPDETQKTALFEINNINEIKVVLYPNPVNHNATIEIIGAKDKNIEISLYSMEGANLNTLYNALNTDQRLELKIDTSELDSEVYIIKVKTGNTEISRKLVVKH